MPETIPQKLPPAVHRFIVSGAISAMLGHGVALRWELDPVWASRNVSINIAVGYSATDKFVNIATVTDTVQYVDAVRRNIDNQPTNLWYVIKVTDVDTGMYSFSSPQPVGTAMRKREWLNSRYLVRAEYTRFTRGRAATRGWLLRRRITGKVCTFSISPETGQVTNTNCPYCFGTGFVGGYYTPQESWMEMDPDITMRRLDPAQGMIVATQKTFRCLAYPMPHPNDYWISGKTGTAYRINDRIAVESMYEEEPLILKGDWIPEQSNNVIYTFPIPKEPHGGC